MVLTCLSPDLPCRESSLTSPRRTSKETPSRENTGRFLLFPLPVRSSPGDVSSSVAPKGSNGSKMLPSIREPRMSVSLPRSKRGKVERASLGTSLLRSRDRDTVAPRQEIIVAPSSSSSSSSSSGPLQDVHQCSRCWLVTHVTHQVVFLNPHDVGGRMGATLKQRMAVKTAEKPLLNNDLYPRSGGAAIRLKKTRTHGFPTSQLQQRYPLLPAKRHNHP